MIRIFLALLVLSACASHPTLEAPQQRQLLETLHDTDGRVLVAAHRGCWHDAPENSVPAMKACIELGVDIVEVDIRLTQDGELILLHDSSFRRMADDERRVDEMKLEEIRQLTLKSRDGRGETAMTDIGVPTFREIVTVSDHHLLLILDLKGDIPSVARAAARELSEMGRCDMAMFALVAPPDKVREIAGPLLDCAGFLPNLRVPMGPMSEVARAYQDLHPVAVAVRFDDWSYLEEGADDISEMGARLWVNTLSDYHAGGQTDEDALKNPDALWGRLINTGVNMIQTDEPEALLRYLGRD